MSDKECYWLHMMLFKEEGQHFDEEALDRILDAYIEAVEKEGYSTGGAFGPPPSRARVCERCEGIGEIEPIPEERKCPTCEGSGEVDPDSMSKEEWEELYGTPWKKT